jgi:hypothetical protein
MGCGCGKPGGIKKSGAADVRRMAQIESVLDKTDYIVYEEDAKVHYGKLSCWAKDGRPGKPLELVCYY